MYKFKVTLKNLIDVELTNEDFESIGTTAQKATAEEIHKLIYSKLFRSVDFDDFEWKEV